MRWSILIALLAILAACHKGIEKNNPEYETENIQVPATFTWKTTREVIVIVTQGEIPPLSGQFGRVDLYHGDPAAGGLRIASGAVRFDLPCRLRIALPAIQQEIYLVHRPVEGNQLTAIQPVSDTIRFAFGQPGVDSPPPDADGDLVPDHIDDFPDDPENAFRSFFPNSEEDATIMFEDIWPYKGDYDLNDLVTRLHFTFLTNTANAVTGMDLRFHIQAVGAGLRDGLGMQFDSLTPDQISWLSGSSLTQGYVTLNGNGTELNQHNAVIILFDKTDNLLHNPASSGNFFNTWPGSEKGWSDTLTMNIRLNGTIPLTSFVPPPYNFFLIQDVTRSIEVHMANYHPTDLANTTLLGTADDSSNPPTRRYYLSRYNIPWALFVPATLPHTYEGIELASAYLNYEKWAISGGAEYADWYLDKPGYRDEEKIYK